MIVSQYVGRGGGAGEWVALLALLVSLVALGWTVYAELTSHRRRQADEYWYRLVFSPNCIDPLIRFADEFFINLQSISPSSSTAETSDLVGRYVADKEAMLSRLWISKVFSSTFYDTACAKLDEIEDRMAQTFGAWAVKPNSASRNDVEGVREMALKNVGAVLSEAAKIDAKKFIRQS